MVSLDRPLEVNDRCDVDWHGGGEPIALTASILAIRKARKKRRGTSSHELEYYVHYLSHDRRLDQWVTLDRFHLDSLVRHEDIDDVVVAPPLRRRNSTMTEEVTTLQTGGGNWHGVSGDPDLAEYEREHEEKTKIKNIETVIMGSWQVEAWYYSPFPPAYSNLDTLYVCEFCLTYMKKAATYRHHRTTCPCRRPPGREIYRNDGLSAFEIDGAAQPAYGQKLCLLAKLFLDHKTLYYDVTPFMFYVVCQVSDHGATPVGYFSKEKASTEGYNLACILTFPQYQKSGFGKFLISLSYELTKREQTTGSPEKPLSDLGKVSYRSYWTHILMNLLANHNTKNDLTIGEMSDLTGIRAEDIVRTDALTSPSLSS